VTVLEDAQPAPDAEPVYGWRWWRWMHTDPPRLTSLHWSWTSATLFSRPCQADSSHGRMGGYNGCQCGCHAYRTLGDAICGQSGIYNAEAFSPVVGWGPARWSWGCAPRTPRAAWRCATMELRGLITTNDYRTQAREIADAFGIPSWSSNELRVNPHCTHARTKLVMEFARELGIPNTHRDQITGRQPAGPDRCGIVSSHDGGRPVCDLCPSTVSWCENGLSELKRQAGERAISMRPARERELGIPPWQPGADKVKVS
jgi:hypothetical protein